MNNRERLWLISSDLIDALGKEFGVWKGMAKKTVYSNIMGDPNRGIPPKLTDAQIGQIIVTLVRDMDTP